ncbi:MBL fold metallo-hydrolase [Xinfangfangia sp. CPCC 101601]|uniref:MBL fold metallo-hydrolase n=1 Tax=Pseudogemmobacter lacusdianii TaxID=3069608 RepID=A0ABU0W117_9RHOB|nr:MBL fold metallo-hydrolase [Xinfangfangia sp. CPCC 101601]MDQ2066795.1 MBL fold metallo-hydrolase [Xinfangfangia sp. CPCC 101601]
MSGAIEKSMPELGPLPGRLRRVLAQNPSPMTGPGTWTEIIGSGEVAVIDPGPGLESHLAAILATLDPGERVTAILVTHAHRDHSELAPALARATGAPILAYGTATDGRSPAMQRLVAAGMNGGGEGLDLSFTPDRLLRHGERISGSDWSLQALHTPGHLGSHLCFAWEDVLFCGDHVMAWAPSLVSPPDGDMGAYMESLAKLAAQNWRLLLPAHGDPIFEPAARLAELTAHRRVREAQILGTLGAEPICLEVLTARIYSDIGPELLPAAQRSALSHLLDLAERKLVWADPSPSPEALWKRV